MLEALRAARGTVARRVASVRAERVRLLDELRALGLEVADTQANVVWFSQPGLDGSELAARLERAKVIVASGAPFGDPSRVRAAVQTSGAGDRLLQALRSSL